MDPRGESFSGPGVLFSGGSWLTLLVVNFSPNDDPGRQIEFPVTCQYRVVAFARAENVPDDLASVIHRFSLDTRAERGNRSRNGIYQSWGFSCTIRDLDTLRALGAALSAIDGVKVVL